MAAALRNRIIDLRYVRASELRANPKNFRTHPANQSAALADLLAEVGIANALIAYQTPDGLTLIDGHLRADTAPDTEWPVLVLDVDEADAAKLLATLDPLAAMAEQDSARLDALLRDVDTGSAAVQAMLAGMASSADLYPNAPSVTAPEDFPAYDDTLATDHTCPKCGYVWSGGT